MKRPVFRHPSQKKKRDRTAPWGLFTGLLLAAVIVLACCCTVQYLYLTTDTVPAQGRLLRPAIERTIPEQLAEMELDLEEIFAAYQKEDPQRLADAYHACVQRDPDMPAYVRSYPELYAVPPTESIYTRGTVYLTFDDGPSNHTAEVLDVLARHGIHATFFVVPRADGSDAELLRRIIREGHTIGVHSATHKYQEIYSSVESYLEDFNAAYERIYQATGQKPAIFRFPGGSLNSYNRMLYQEIITEMLRRGFTYYDWNVEGGEETHTTPASAIQQAAISGALKQDRPILLLHDGPEHSETVNALEGILTALEARGYQFAPLDPSVQPVTFTYPE